MKKLTILALMLAFAWGASAQFYMHVWYNDSLFTFPVQKVDSITFTDKWLEPGEPVEPEPETPSVGIGVFSVSADKKVTFSPGNLQYTQSTNTWAFASAQWEMLGTDNVTGGSVSTDATFGDTKYGDALADKIDLFGWSTSATNFGVSTSTDYNDYSGSFVDWGTNKIGADAPNTWRTLSFDEWGYLLNNRPNASSLCGVAQVNGVNGLILLPDNWVCPSDITFKSGFHSSYGVDYYAAYQIFTVEQWSKLEAVGAVFLPAAGDRYGYVGYVQSNGSYWSATENNSSIAYYLYFGSAEADMRLVSRSGGQSVRLVKDTIANSTNQPTDPYNGHEYVDLGLPSGLKWATCNVGANAPEEYGDYFAWGEVESKTTYNWSTYKWCNGSNSTLTKYNYKDGYGTLDNKMVLDKEDDAAAVNWGGNWRMPTKAEQDELLSNCTWTWTTQNGVNGYKVTGPSGNCIFLPAVGYRKESSLSRDGSNGNFWLSSLYEGLPDNAYGLFFDSEEHVWSIFYRFYGRPVRPVCDTPDDVLPSEPEAPTPVVGVFSVAEGKTVTFSPGNLQYTQSTNTWTFAENQYDYIGTDNVTGGGVSTDPTWGDSKSGTALADKVDLFGWSTPANNFGVSTSMDNNDYSGSFVDWGTNKIGNDAPNTWRTLTHDEWYYLRYTRTNANDLYGVAQVNGVNGLIFLPDNWTCPEGVTFKSGFHGWDGIDYYAEYQTFTAEQWAKIEAAGAIFLPAAGYREGTYVYNVQYNGGNWSATERNSNGAYGLYFYSEVVGWGYSDRIYGRSVRLVKDVEDEPVEPEQPGEGGEEPAKNITVRAQVPAAWTNTITAWVWPTGGAGKEVVPTKEGDWYVYTENCAELNIIFKNGAGWSGDANQTVDMTFSESTCIAITAGSGKATYTVVDCPTIGLTYSVTVPAGTHACYIAGEMNGWNQVEMEKVDETHYKLEVASATEAMKYKYCSGPGWAYVEKTANGYELADRTYSANDVVESWAAVYDPSVEPETPSVGIGVFSVSADKKVTFSPGNLQYTQSTNTWSFASAQWEMLGTDNVTGGDVKSDPTCGYSRYGYFLADKIDLFGWSASATNFGVHTSTNWEDDYLGPFVDWGTNKIGNDAPNTWRTLSYDEWIYVVFDRPNASSLRGVAQVNGVNGLILLPDNWTCPEGVTFKSDFHDESGVDYYAAYQTFTADQWSKLEAAGAVFLPASGYRSGSVVYFVQYRGSYWSATEYLSYRAYYLYFYSGEADTYIAHYTGCSVRLVKNVK